jgi:hypothetical protein
VFTFVVEKNVRMNAIYLHAANVLSVRGSSTILMLLFAC